MKRANLLSLLLPFLLLGAEGKVTCGVNGLKGKELELQCPAKQVFSPIRLWLFLQGEFVYPPAEGSICTVDKHDGEFWITYTDQARKKHEMRMEKTIRIVMADDGQGLNH